MRFKIRLVLAFTSPPTTHYRSLVSKPSPVSLAKGVKNESELEGMRAAHVRDGVAMVLALSRLERDVAAGQLITEVDVDERITAARAQQAKFVGKLIFCDIPTTSSIGCSSWIKAFVAQCVGTHLSCPGLLTWRLMWHLPCYPSFRRKLVDGVDSVPTPPF